MFLEEADFDPESGKAILDDWFQQIQPIFSVID